MGRRLVGAGLVGSALLAAWLGHSALGVPRRNFPIGVAVSPNGDLALVGNEERAGEVRRLPDLQIVRVLEAEKGSYVRWHPKEPRVALFSTHLWIYSTQDWRLVHHSVAAFVDVAFHGDKPQLIGLQKTGEQAGEVQHSLVVTDLTINPEWITFPIPDRRPNRVVYVGRDQALVLGSDGNGSLWDLSARAQLGTGAYEGMRGPLAVDAAAGVRRLAGWVSQDTGKAGLIELPSLAAVRTFDAHKRGYAECLRFSPDAAWLATGAGYPESSLKLWSVQSGELLGTKTGVQPLDVGWTADGKTLVLCDRRLEQASTLAVSEVLKDQP
jgi:WD40 repeat protein